MQDFRKLKVWQRAQETCVQIYMLSGHFPVEERYGITSQLRKAAVSVGANLAEGSKRASPTDKARIFNIAQAEAGPVNGGPAVLPPASSVLPPASCPLRCRLPPRVRGHDLERAAGRDG